MSDEIAPETKRKPGRPRKRKDPDDAPIDGHYKRDLLLNKEPGKRYAILDEKEDAAEFRSRGYRRVERQAEGGVRPLWDTGDPSDSHYSVKGLVVYEADEEKLKKWDQAALDQSNGRMAAINAAAKRTGADMGMTMKYLPR